MLAVPFGVVTVKSAAPAGVAWAPVSCTTMLLAVAVVGVTTIAGLPGAVKVKLESGERLEPVSVTVTAVPTAAEVGDTCVRDGVAGCASTAWGTAAATASTTSRERFTRPSVRAATPSPSRMNGLQTEIQ